MRPAQALEKIVLGLNRRWLERAARRGPPPEPVAPADGGRGRLPTEQLPGGHRPWEGALDAGNRVLAELSSIRWDTCPETGAVLPTGHRLALDAEPGAWVAARRAHRHRWFSTLARTWAETGSVAHAVAATTALGEWIAADRPEAGVPWLHASDAAIRLIHWTLGAGWLGEELDADLWRRMAGSAAAHARFLEQNLSLGSCASDHRLIAQSCGLVVAGLSWPELDGARRWWSQGLTLLGRHLPAQLHADGGPRDLSLSTLSRSLLLTLVARASCRVNGVAFPADAESALTRAAWLLRVAGGDLGALPPVGQVVESPLAPWGSPISATPWDAVVPTLAGGEGSPHAAEDRLAAALSGSYARPGAPLRRDREWVMFAFRSSGLLFLHGAVKKRPSRIVFQAGCGEGLMSHQDLFQILWDVGDTEILADPGSEGPGAPAAATFSRAEAHGQLLHRGRGLPAPGQRVAVQIERARADGRDASMVASSDGYGFTWKRDVRVGGARIVVLDHLGEGAEGEIVLRWPLGPSWVVEAIADSACSATAEGLTLKIKLPPELSWTLERSELVRGGLRRSAPVLVGRGQAAAGARYRSSFEIR